MEILEDIKRKFEALSASTIGDLLRYLALNLSTTLLLTAATLAAPYVEKELKKRKIIK